jgi:predicted ArsR family transcriptional regulator
MSARNPNIQNASDRILGSLRQDGAQTARELAVRFGITGVAVRTQLRALMATGLIRREWTQREGEAGSAGFTRALGRPSARYSLTPAADALFPKQYERFARQLLETLKTQLGPEALDRILAHWESELHAHLDATLPQQPAARLQALAQHQSANGFMAEVQQDAQGGIALIERNCPIATLAAKHPEICDHEASLFSRTLKWKTTLESCQARGDGVCVFRIGRAKPAATAVPPPAMAEHNVPSAPPATASGHRVPEPPKE